MSSFSVFVVVLTIVNIGASNGSGLSHSLVRRAPRVIPTSQPSVTSQNLLRVLHAASQNGVKLLPKIPYNLGSKISPRDYTPPRKRQRGSVEGAKMSQSRSDMSAFLQRLGYTCHSKNSCSLPRRTKMAATGDPAATPEAQSDTETPVDISTETIETQDPPNTTDSEISTEHSESINPEDNTTDTQVSTETIETQDPVEPPQQ